MTNEICVPLAALSIADEGDREVMPEPGDPVSFQVEGDVSRVEGGMVYVTPRTANGEPIPEPMDKGMYEGMDEGVVMDEEIQL